MKKASKAYKAALIISILYPGGECDTACQREGSDQPRTFCRNHGMKLQQNVARGMQAEIMSLSLRPNKPAHIH